MTDGRSEMRLPDALMKRAEPLRSNEKRLASETMNGETDDRQASTSLEYVNGLLPSMPPEYAFLAHRN